MIPDHLWLLTICSSYSSLMDKKYPLMQAMIAMIIPISKLIRVA